MDQRKTCNECRGIYHIFSEINEGKLKPNASFEEIKDSLCNYGCGCACYESAILEKAKGNLERRDEYLAKEKTAKYARSQNWKGMKPED